MTDDDYLGFFYFDSYAKYPEFVRTLTLKSEYQQSANNIAAGVPLKDEPNEAYEAVVETLLPGGEGIVRHHKQRILVRNVVTGDHIRFHIKQKRRGVLHGELIEVISPSKQRITAPCAVAESCGGCALQHMNQSEQARLKSSWVRQAFSPFITSSTQYIELLPHQAYFAGRRRVRWFIEHQQLGFRQAYSHQTIHSSQCIALSQSLDRLRRELEQQLPVWPNHIESIQAVELSNGFHLILESKQGSPENFMPTLSENKPTQLQWWWRKLETPSIKPLNRPIIPLFDSIDLSPYRKHNINIQIGANDFIQGHQQGNQQLIKQILHWTQGNQRVVDLFSGCGNLSLPIAAAHGAQIIGAELNNNSVAAANHNAKRLQLQAAYTSIDLFGAFKIEAFVGADTLILDPPRKGAKDICKKIAQFFPKQIIMVNCDATAGARDALSLQQAGFKLKALRPLDLFPHTGHVEVISLWT